MKQNILITFNNTHSVIQFEKKIKDNNKYDLRLILMPTPRILSLSCGTCIKIENIDLKDVLEIIESENLTYKEIYEICKNGYKLFKR